MNSFISWIGGKKLLRKQILEQFPDQSSYSRYIEVFGGAGWVLFSKDKHALLEVFNDMNGELINLYRVVKYHPEPLQKELEWLLMSREQFFDELNRNTRGMTDIQRAARYFCLIRESFGTDCKSFRVSPRDMQKAVDYLKEVSGRLNRVVIENQDFERLIKTYDRPDALFYLDPLIMKRRNIILTGSTQRTMKDYEDAWAILKENLYCPIMTLSRSGICMRDIKSLRLTEWIIW